ncbi:MULTISPECIES: hypothetical protein [unclassified Rathayibacter]|uniref:hypothetical protein n=1 Tax=unclassified Rathayibacter TaxID=2609250 RepID=UPI0006FFBDD7|nr:MULTISPECIES: hypothetical protein [unclassified Rathayibacter]KQQ03933.1 hypothetical protein ASF42_10810 [Rathayibacter sp. Leaf294]KQS12387.1 hypothetical protein ASG06_10810 [Rathayibacter sp. Leaf185]
MPDRTALDRTAPPRTTAPPLARAGRSLLSSSLAVVVLALAACTALPADVPEDAVLGPGSSVPLTTVTPTGSLAVDGDDLTQRITLCLARYGLGERPSLPDETATADERLSAQQLLDAYDATMTDCSAEALGTAPATSAPATSAPATTAPSSTAPATDAPSPTPSS